MKAQSLQAVYFRRLARDAYKPKARPKLLETLKFAESQYKPLSSESHGFGGGAAILAMASAEAAKEQALLDKVFNTHLNIDLSQPGAIKMLTEAINDAFQFRSIYERNKALILSEDFNGQKGVYSYFNTYFSQALRRSLPTIVRDIKSRMLADHSLSAGDAALFAFEAAAPRLIDNAIKRMFGNANVELQNSMDQQHRNAYQNIINAMKDFPRQSVITQQLYHAWGIDEVAKQFSEAFSKQHRQPKKATIERGRVAAENQVSKAMHSKGGLSLEAVIDQCLSMVANGINSSNVQVQAGIYKGAGDVKARADNVFYFNMDSEPIDKAFQQVAASNSDRETAVNAFTSLGSQLDNIKDGFIVYVNDKNYTLNDNFRGMSAGSTWDLYQVQSILGGVVANIDQIIYNLLQNGQGAIEAGDTENASKILAEGIAYYLFDDYNTIGNPGGNAIHVMGLQGMLIPLSAFLYALGTALNHIEYNASSYVRVSISTPAVNDSDEASYGEENWDIQYETSMEKTRISIHFLENFISFVKGYL